MIVPASGKDATGPGYSKNKFYIVESSSLVGMNDLYQLYGSVEVANLGLF